MPRRDDLQTILVLGSGPIVIGQACEFDYSGSQAVQALRREGYRVVLVNSNPATIMTDTELADATYIEPLTVPYVREVIRKERPDAILPTMGGQTALNLAKALHEEGVLAEFGVELIGAAYDVIERAEDRTLFKRAMEEIGVDMARSGFAHNLVEALDVVEQVGFPAILRPSFTMGGTGGNISYNRDEYEQYIRWALDASPTREVLVEESLIGWKEFELELMRDHMDNVVIICSIENLDPMGVHTGDSITVAPAQTLTDAEYQAMRDEAIAIIRKIGVETGGCNIQFAVCPRTGRRVVIEINPRVSRSSALASKATGFPIAKMAALLAVGFSLDEIPNDITRVTPASFEPVIDYTVVKIPRFTFEKFPGARPVLTTQMKSVGEVMSIGRSFPEAMMKATRSLETGRAGLVPLLAPPGEDGVPADVSSLREFFGDFLRVPGPDRFWYIADALGSGLSVDEVAELTGVDPWFLDQLLQVIELENEIKDWNRVGGHLESPEGQDLLLRAKRFGISDEELGRLLDRSELAVRQARLQAGLRPVYKKVDTCAAEFEAQTPYLYSTWERVDEVEVETSDRRVIILGGGPNRIGQGIEFDYCAVHGVKALREAGYETIMVNCNPETVSTDYDVPDRLYFEPLTFEDVMEIVEREKPTGVILQFGGQTPLKLALPLMRAGVRILGTHPDIIDKVEDRKRFGALIEQLGLQQPPGGTAQQFSEALQVARGVGYPVLVRPSYVLGGRAMQIIHEEDELLEFFEMARAAGGGGNILIDRFLDDAIEVDVDCIGDGEDFVIGGIMQHIEEAGVHSGDSACSLPPYSLAPEVVDTIAQQTVALARALGIVGLMNVQFAVRQGEVFVLEVNPRASRTIPYVSKSIGHPLAKYAARVMVGESLREIGFTTPVVPEHFAVKEAILPFKKFPGVDSLLGPEMKSTGEVMGIDSTFEGAFWRAQIAASNPLPSSGRVFVSVRDRDKAAVVEVARRLVDLGFEIVATRGTGSLLREQGLPVTHVNKVKEGRPHIVDRIINGQIAMVVNTTIGRQAIEDSRSIRRATVERDVPYFTTVAGARAAVGAMHAHSCSRALSVRSIQSYHASMNSD
ncbi:MAG: carbamoyl-phosphate synthase large subunit [Deltaproteobacteria bacterium]|nr:MAG: carbamoyl-phosphate synthase large subunit [Deltaproteobacteria bacterium]